MAALIWLAHIGFDRMLGYGLKYAIALATPISAAKATSHFQRRLRCAFMHFKPAACRSSAPRPSARGAASGARLGPLIDSAWSDWLPTYAFAIEHPDGVILVDTGSNAGLMKLPRWHPYFRLAVHFDIERERRNRASTGAASASAPRDVKTVVLTHMHIDHDGGLKDLPYSEVLAAPGELAIASGMMGQIRGYLPQRWPAGFDPKPLALEPKPFGPFASSRASDPRRRGDRDPDAGPYRTIICRVAVVDEDVTLLIAGDAAYTRGELAGRPDRRRQRRRSAGAGDFAEFARFGGGAADGVFADPRSADAGAAGCAPRVGSALTAALSRIREWGP